jgi:DNA-binding NtrC family response regulator
MITLRADDEPARSTPLSLLVVDDDEGFRESLVAALRAQGFATTAVDSCAAARASMEERAYDAILVDRKLPDGDGVELLHDRPRRDDTEFIMITGNGTVSSAVDALKQGADDYLTKPLDPAKLKSTLAHLTRTRALKNEVRDLRAELISGGRFGAIVARSDAMRPVFEQIARVAPTDASVLIEGESGTGKEMVAEAIHKRSARRDAPLIPINCGAIPEALIESELFGHERGSFTGADRLHRGFFERADGGTLFLDEITEMPVRLQVKLLRVIETRHVQRIGSMEQLPIDVRVLAATNRRPKEAIREGSLREDLYFRLAVFPIRLPTLRERRGDVALLAEHFLGLLNDAHDTKKAWSSGALAELESREWPGNVRELKNAVYRAFILADDLLVAESAIVDLPNEATPATPVRAGATIAETERALILATLEHTNGNKPAAAKLLGVSLKTLYTRLSAYNATKP